MITRRRMTIRHVSRLKTALALLALVGLGVSLGACSAGSIFGTQPESAVATPAAAEPDPAAAPAPPPIDLAGHWQLSAAAGGACFMTLGQARNQAASPDGAAQGPIAPEGGCPGNFFTSRKWTFEHDSLIIRDFKGRPLAQLSYLGGHFEGQDKSGGALTLSRQP